MISDLRTVSNASPGNSTFYRVVHEFWNPFIFGKITVFEFYAVGSKIRTVIWDRSRYWQLFSEKTNILMYRFYRLYRSENLFMIFLYHTFCFSQLLAITVFSPYFVRAWLYKKPSAHRWQKNWVFLKKVLTVFWKFSGFIAIFSAYTTKKPAVIYGERLGATMEFSPRYLVLKF